jgi:hypothetical protein
MRMQCKYVESVNVGIQRTLSIKLEDAVTAEANA